MAHPQNSPRGFFAKARVDFPAAESSLTYNSTGIIFSGALFVNGEAAVGKITANSTALVFPASGVQMAALTSLKITSNSTGIKIGARYISTNTTGNSTT